MLYHSKQSLLIILLGCFFPGASPAQIYTNSEDYVRSIWNKKEDAYLAPDLNTQVKKLARTYPDIYEFTSISGLQETEGYKVVHSSSTTSGSSRFIVTITLDYDGKHPTKSRLLVKYDENGHWWVDDIYFAYGGSLRQELKKKYHKPVY